MSIRLLCAAARRRRCAITSLLLAIIPFAESALAQTPQFVKINPLYFTMQVGGPNPSGQEFFVTSAGSDLGFGVAVTTVTGGNWLKSSRGSCCQSTPADMVVSVDGAALPAGTYTGQVTFTSGTLSMTVPVTLTVGSPGGAVFGNMVSELGFVFGGGINPVPPSQTIQLTNAGAETLNWTVAVSTFQGSNWLSVGAPSGTAPSIVTVNVATQGLQPGLYTGQLLFQSGNGSVTIPVSLVVGSNTAAVFQQVNGFSFTMPVRGPNPLPEEFFVTSTGSNFGFGVAVTTVTGGNWLKSSRGSCCQSTPADMVVSVDGAALPAGTYIGQILFYSGNTFMTVPVTLTVGSPGGAVFGNMVSELGFVFGGGINPVPPPQTIQLTNAGTGTLYWTVAVSTFQGSNWLSVGAPSGTAPSIVTVSVSAQSLQPGLYTGQLLFQSGSSSVTIPVSLVVGSNTAAVFQQVNGFSFTMPVGGPNPLGQEFFVTSTGSNLGFSVAVTTVTGGNWLKSSRGSCCQSTPADMVVSVDGAALPAGTYIGQILFYSGNTFMTVPVTLTVGNPGGAVFGETVSELSFVFGGGINPVPPSQTIQLTNAGAGTLNWAAVVSTFQGSNWLSVGAPSGTAPSIVTVSVSAQSLQPGLYTGQLLFQSGSSSVTIPVSLVVGSNTAAVFQQVNGFSFTMPVGGPNPLGQEFFVTSTGSNLGFSVAVTTVTGGNWLKSSRGSCCQSTPADMVVSVDGAALPAGTYIGQILFYSGNTFMTVPVTLTVGNPGGAVFGETVSELSFVFGGGINPVPPSQTIQLTNAGAGTLNWAAAVSTFQGSNWLSVGAPAGRHRQ